jgi:neurotransmitter:Na+ symporter, NSS family
MPISGRRGRKRDPRAGDDVASEAAPVAGSIADMGTRHERWSDTPTFVLAVAGAAIGFKTIWQFPYLASQNGGGAFVLIYALLSLVFGTPLLIAQIMLGRRAHASPVKALSDLGARLPGRRAWGIVGALAVLGGFIVFSYLSVIAGWTIAYFVRAAFGALSGLTADGIGSLFAIFVRDPEKQVFWHSLFTIMVVAVSVRGVRRGLEPAARWLVPTLYGLLLLLAAYAIRVSSLEDVARYLFSPDFDKLSPYAWLVALAQVFFSLGLGTGVAMMYGAYLKADASIGRAGAVVVGLDVLTNVVAAIFVFAILFGGSVAPASGPSLVFQVLPLAFDHLPFGRWVVAAFFALLVIAALVFGIALFESVIVWLAERFAVERTRATIAIGLAAWALGLVTVFSFNYAAFSFKFLGVEKRLGAFDVLQSLSAETMLPLAALLIAVFAGWLLKAEAAREELAMRSPCSFDAWLWSLRVLAPPLLLLLLATVYRL